MSRTPAQVGLSRPTVSVIIPAYRASSYLAGAIRSALEQTVPPHEVIVVDDASPDVEETARAIEAWTKTGRVRLLRQERNRGPAAARNRAIAASSGSLLAFLDADDRFEKERLEAAIEVFANHPDTAMTCSDSFLCVEEVVQPGLKNDAWRPIDEVLSFERLLQQNCIYTLTVTLRRDVFDAFGPFDESPALIAVEDYELWLRIARERVVRYIDRPLACYNLSPSSLSGNPRRMFDGVSAVLTKLERHYPDFRARYGGLADRRRFDLRMDLAWVLLERGERAAARREAWCAVRERPSASRAWKLWAKTLVGRS
ncbi:MAG: glycosyltransferase family 2 protein [Planctomycetes bacterium]|nr:glycosyltransferase family 2 protein [Planctomycetota bacterium]